MQCITVHAMFFYVKCTSLTKVVPNKLNEDLPLSVWVDSNTSVPKTKILKCSDFSWNSLTWSGCGLPHRQVCLAPSVQEPLFRSRGPEGSSPSARSGWSRTSRRHQIPQSTLWTKNISNPEINSWSTEKRCCWWCQTSHCKVKCWEGQLDGYLAYSSNQSATEAFSQPPCSCNPSRHIWEPFKYRHCRQFSTPPNKRWLISANKSLNHQH